MESVLDSPQQASLYAGESTAQHTDKWAQGALRRRLSVRLGPTLHSRSRLPEVAPVDSGRNHHFTFLFIPINFTF